MIPIAAATATRNRTMLQTLGNVSSLLLGTAILVVGNALLGIVLPVRMGLEHVPEFLSGLVMSAFYLGFVLGSARIQVLIRRSGHIRAFAALAAILTCCAMLHSLIFEVWVWMALRVLSGFCMAGLYAIIESWLNVRSTNETRGQVLAIYVVTVYTASFGGQFLVNIGSVGDGELFAIVGLAVALSLVPVVLTRVAGPEIDKIKAMSLMALYRASPLGVVVTGGAGLISGAFYALGAIYANALGLSVFHVSLFMGAPIFGGLALQYPIGRLSDRYDRRSVLLGVIGGTMIASVTLMLLAMIATAAQNDSKTAGRASSEKMADRRRRLLRMEEGNQRCKIRDAAYAAPNPLSMLTTVTPAAQLFSIESSAAIPPKLAP